MTGTPGLIDPSEHALEQCSFKDSAVGAEDKLSLFAPFDDQRLSTLMARSGFLASQQALRRHSRHARFFAVRTGDIPPHAGPDPHRLIVLLRARDDEIVVAVGAHGDHAPGCASLGGYAHIKRLGTVWATYVLGLDGVGHMSMLPRIGRRTLIENFGVYLTVGVIAYSADMSHHSREPRGAHDSSSPQIRVRGAGDFRHYSNQRLRLPNERPPLGPRLKQLLGAVLTLAVVGGIGVAVYYGVTQLIADDEPATSYVAEATAEDQSAASEQQAQQASELEPEEAETSVEESESTEAATTASEAESTEAETAEQAQAEQTTAGDAEQESSASDAPPVSVSTIEPSVSDQVITPAQLGGAEISAERVTAEPIPSGIPRALADGAVYDPTEPATVFTARWPVGTTLRLVRLPGATLLTDEEQDQVVGTETLVVVRGTESSNTDLQLSPAAFDQIAIYGTERIIAVRVEVTAGPP